MATTNIAYGTETAITWTPGALADNSARECTAVDNSSNLYVDAMLNITVKAGSTTPAGEKGAYVWFYGSHDGTDYTDNATGSDAALTMRSPTNLLGPWVVSIPTASVDYKIIIPSVANFFGGVLPKKWGFVLENKQGGALTTGSTANYTGITYTTA